MSRDRVYERATCRDVLVAATRDVTRYFTAVQASVWCDHDLRTVQVALGRLCEEGVLVRRQSGCTMFYRRPA